MPDEIAAASVSPDLPPSVAAAVPGPGPATPETPAVVQPPPPAPAAVVNAPPPSASPPSEGVSAGQPPQAVPAGSPTGRPPVALPPAPAPVVQAPLAYRATHLVPAGGIPAWSRPDPSLTPEHRLDPGLDVMLAESYPNGWARIICSNEWSAWVDGRVLVPAGQVAPGQAPGASKAATAAGGTGTGAQIRNEIGVAALLGIVAWFAGAFGPVGLLVAVVRTPWLVGIAIAIGLAVARLLWRRAPRALDVTFFVVDAVVVTLVLWVFADL